MKVLLHQHDSEMNSMDHNHQSTEAAGASSISGQERHEINEQHNQGQLYQNGIHFTGVSAANQNSQTPFRTQPFRDLNRTPAPRPSSVLALALASSRALLSVVD